MNNNKPEGEVNVKDSNEKNDNDEAEDIEDNNDNNEIKINSEEQVMYITEGEDESGDQENTDIDTD